jgi:hypothetical protein
MRYRLPFAIAPPQPESLTSRTSDHISSQRSTLRAHGGCVGKHPTPQITDVLLSAARACPNCGIENVLSVCTSDTTKNSA